MNIHTAQFFQLPVSLSILGTFSLVRAIIDGVWICSRIYWTLKHTTCDYTYRSVLHKDYCSHSQSSLRCLVTSSNSGRRSASRITSLQAGGHLTPAFYSSNCGLRTLSRLMAVGPRCIASGRIPQKTPLSTVLLLLYDVPVGTDCRKHRFLELLHCCVLHSRYLPMTPLDSQFWLSADMLQHPVLTTHKLCTSLNVRNQVTYPYKARGKFVLVQVRRQDSKLHDNKNSHI
jgi:hypothetical protein